MILRAAFVATVLTLVFESASAEQKHLELPEVASRSYAQNFKDLALSACIAAAYASDPKASADAGATTGGLASTWTNDDAELAAGEITRLVAKYLAREYHSIHGPGIKLDLMKCLDLYHGEELDRLTRRVVPQPNRSYRQDDTTRPTR